MHPAHTFAPADRLAQTLTRTNTIACVGLDPVLEQLPDALRTLAPVAAIEAFSRGVVQAIASAGVGVVKVQSACYERYGSAGFAAMERTIAASREAGLLVVLDAKRGDIGISASHYAAAASAMGAHWITVSGYLGPSTIEPYLQAGLGVFVLVRTSNPDSDSVQAHTLASGASVAEMMASHVRTLGERFMASEGTGPDRFSPDRLIPDRLIPDRLSPDRLSSVGAVVGATKPQDGPRLRALMPSTTFLVPGYGAQGGTLADIRGMMRPGSRTAATAGVLVTASRSVIYPKPAPDAAGTWEARVEQAARALVGELAAA
jgi:orotidine-5'-phosphate decarboxylase